MTKAKTNTRRPLRKAITQEDQGTVYPHLARIILHKPKERSIEETFTIAMTQLLRSKVSEDFIIVRGILEYGPDFPTNEAILAAVNKPPSVPTPTKKTRRTSKPHVEELSIPSAPSSRKSGKKPNEPEAEEPETLLDPILNEPSRRTITLSADKLPALHTTIASHIKEPIQTCVDYLNEVNNANPHLAWDDRILRNPDSTTLMFTIPVPPEEQHMVQIRHVDFFGFQRRCISCHVGISDNIRLQIYDEDTSRWLEVTYGRGDILLVRGHKFHRGTNHSEPDTKIRCFIYIEDEAYQQELLTHPFATKGAVFSAGIKDLDAWYKKEAKLEKESTAITQQEKRMAKKAGRARKLQALAEWRRLKAASAAISEAPETGQTNHSP